MSKQKPMKSRWVTWCWPLAVSLTLGAACSTEDDDLGGAGDGGADGVAFQHSCTKPETNPTTGLVTCQEGYQHRPEAVTCGARDGSGGEGSSLGVGGDGSARLPRAGEGVRCSESGVAGAGGAGSGDCAEYEHGFCKWYEGEGTGGALGLCRSGCANDAECGPGFVCICDEPDSPTGGACKPASCATDADCDQGLLCASYYGSCNRDGFACQLPSDECQSNDDCDDGTCNWRTDQQRHFCDRSRCLP